MKKESSAAFSSSKSLFPLLIFLFFIPSFQARNLQQCSSTCGDLKDIRYPFRFQGDPAGCGDIDFQLSCQNNNNTILNYLGGTYYVKGISYDQRTIHLVDVNLADGTCNLPNKSLSMDEATQDSRFPSLMTYWQANFMNCSRTIPELEVNRVPCLSGDTFNVYVNFSNRNFFANEIPRTCKVISRVPTSSQNELNYPYNEATLKLLASGFELRWSVECRDCRAVGRGCVYEDNTDQRIFQCETIHDDGNGPILRAVIIVYSALFSLIEVEYVIRFTLLPLVVFGFLLHKLLTTRKTVADDLKMPPKPVAFPPHGHAQELQSDTPTQELIPESIERSA